MTIKLLQPLVVGACALLVAAAPPSAVAPDTPEEASCTLPGKLAIEAPSAAQQALIDHLSRRYLIASDATERMVAVAHQAGRDFGLDPLLVLAVISVESRFNPIAESGMGAKGLMQIIPEYHMDKLRKVGGEEAVFDPDSNIRVGAQILREYVRRTGSLEAGLQFYNGALNDEQSRYARKVLAERARLARVAQGAGEKI